MAAPVIARVRLTVGEWAVVNRPIVGEGGLQTLLKRIMRRSNRYTREVELFPQDIVQARTYTTRYGHGGFQDRFRILLGALERDGYPAGETVSDRRQ